MHPAPASLQALSSVCIQPQAACLSCRACMLTSTPSGSSVATRASSDRPFSSSSVSVVSIASSRASAPMSNHVSSTETGSCSSAHEYLTGTMQKAAAVRTAIHCQEARASAAARAQPHRRRCQSPATQTPLPEPNHTDAAARAQPHSPCKFSGVRPLHASSAACGPCMQVPAPYPYALVMLNDAALPPNLVTHTAAPAAPVLCVDTPMRRHGRPRDQHASIQVHDGVSLIRCPCHWRWAACG
eukprot:364268-Chlamydomonas_euryale.AAC.21